MGNAAISFKDPLWMSQWLDTALEMEQAKYKSCPVKPDLVPEHEVAQAWGFVVAGYFLVEESFKALLRVRGKDVPGKHALSMLYSGLESTDQDLLREYYSDYRETGGWAQEFPFSTLEEFLVNLDGDRNRQGTDHLGSLDWRYFPIEEVRSAKMPTVSIECLHEIAYGCIRIVEYATNGDIEPSAYTHSFRLKRERDKKRTDWLTVRMNSGGWGEQPDRLEKFWGPDYKGRYDWLLFRGNKIKPSFEKIPKGLSLPIVDKREEFESFDVKAGLRSIGINRSSQG